MRIAHPLRPMSYWFLQYWIPLKGWKENLGETGNYIKQDDEKFLHFHIRILNNPLTITDFDIYCLTFFSKFVVRDSPASVMRGT